MKIHITYRNGYCCTYLNGSLRFHGHETPYEARQSMLRWVEAGAEVTAEGL